MGRTKIEWTDHSINPIRARSKESVHSGHWCEKISPGCKNCYASALQRRFKMYEFVASNRDKVQPYLDQSKLQQVLRRRKPTMYFWCDMTDMFGEWVPFSWIDQCLAVMALTPQHTHQVLTKRPGRMLEYFDHLARAAADHAPHTASGQFSPLNVLNIRWAALHQRGGTVSGWHCTGEAIDCSAGWPLSNAWMGVSVESQKYVDRIRALAECPAAVRFVSFEPLLGPVDASQWLPRIDQAIVGGESGPRARASNIAWHRDLFRQCRDTGTAFFEKQLGANIVCADESLLPDNCTTTRIEGGWRVSLKDPKGGDPEEWPDDLRVREFPEVST